VVSAAAADIAAAGLGEDLVEPARGVLAHEPADQRDALVQIREPLGIALELVGVAAQLVGRVIDQRFDLAELLRDGLERRVGAHPALDLACCRGDAITGGVIAAVQHVFGGTRRALEQIDRCEADSLELDRLVFSGREVGGVQLVELVAQVIDARLALALVSTESCERVIAPAQLGPRGGHGFDERLGGAERIEEIAMARGIDEALVLMLTRKIDEQCTQLREPRGRGQRAVDVRARSTTALDDATNEHLVGVSIRVARSVRALRAKAGQPGTLEHGDHPVAQIGWYLDDRLDDRFVGTRARNVRGRASSSQEVHGFDDE
jgi:hypothetical protein